MAALYVAAHAKGSTLVHLLSLNGWASRMQHTSKSQEQEKVIMSVLWISCRALLASKLVTIQLQDKVTGLAAPFEAVVSRALGLQLA